MNQKRLSLLILIVFPIFSILVVFFCLYLFSNIKPTTNFVYFEQNNYSSQNSIKVIDNKINVETSEIYKTQKIEIDKQKQLLEDCKTNSVEINAGLNCEKKFPLPILTYQDNTLPKIYLYNAQKNMSKEIDLETAKTLSLISEKQNDAGESFANDNCGSSSSPFFVGGYYGQCGNNSSQIAIKKGGGSKTIDLETIVNLDASSYVTNNNTQRNIFWVK